MDNISVCVFIRNPAPGNLRSGNLRGEPRWERQALEACLNNPQVGSVYTSGHVWGGSHPKYKGKMRPNVAAETVLLTHDWHRGQIQGYNYKAVFANIFSSPAPTQVSQVKDTNKQLNGKLFFTLGYPHLYNEVAKIEQLENFLPRDNIVLLPVPGSPGVVHDSNFDKTKLLWAQRCAHMLRMENSLPLLWSLQQLDKNKDLTLEVLSGWSPREAKNYVDGRVISLPDVTKAWWELEKFAPYIHLKDRVTLHPQLGWDEVLTLYGQSKLLLTYGLSFGGPPVEAGMYGIPIVTNGISGAMVDCEEYLHTATEADALLIYERLLNDREFYDRVGSSYRDYVDKTYTYAAFNANFNRLLVDKSIF